MAALFISYTRADSEAVERVEELLKQNNIDIWRDKNSMPYAVNWDDAVIEALCRSSYAVIFDSAARQEKLQKSDSAVQREADWIKEIHIPNLTVDLENNHDPEFITKEILKWMAEEKRKYGKENDNLRTLISGAYACKNNAVSFEKNDIPRGVIKKAVKLFDLFCFKKELDSTPDFGCGSLNLRGSMYGFIKQYRKRILSGLVMQLTVVIAVILTAFYGIWSGIEFYKSYMTYNNMTMLVQGKTTYSRAYDTDVILGASVLNSSSIESQFTLFYNYVRVLGSKYPSGYYDSADADEIVSGLAKNRNSGYYVQLSSNDGIVNVNDDNGFCNSFVVDGIPSDYDWSEDGKCLAVSTANKVFLYYMGSVYSPEELKGSYEDISQVFIHDQKVYAITVKQNVVVWDISANKVMELDYSISNGCISSRNGSVAAFISDNTLVVNRCGDVTGVSLPSDITFSSGDLAVSHDGKKIVVLGNDSQYTGSIYEYDIESGNLNLIYTAEGYLSAVDYSFDDSAVIFGDRSASNLKKLDLKSQTVKESKSTDYPVSSVKAYKGGSVVCLRDSTLTSVSDDMVFSKNTSESTYGNLARQIAVSDVDEAYFIVSRNANNLGSAKYFISGESKYLIIDPEQSETAANSAVSVSEDGGYVAFGNDDGRITIRSVSTLLPVWINRDVKEGIVALSFSEDGRTLYALGNSGTVHSILLPPQISECSGGDYAAQLSAMRKQGREIFDRLSSLGLTDFSLEEFLLEKAYEVKEI